MFQLDERFLEDIGLGELPEEQKKPFLRYIYDELELRVGTKLSEGLENYQLEEFESIIDRKNDVIESWLEKNVQNYKKDVVYLQLMKNININNIDDENLKAEYCATKWLEINRPDYKQVVALTFDEIKREIIGNKDAILGK